MPTSAILNVAIGMIFIYLVLSLICTAAREMLESVLRYRASDLERGLQELLQDPDRTGLVRALYEHPLIDSLYKGDYHPDARTRKAHDTELPSYIPARSFALALMDLVQRREGSTPSGASSATSDPPAIAPGTIPLPAPGPANPRPMDTLRAAIGDSPLLKANDGVRRSLFALVDAAGDDVNKARANIETWFNSAMDRVSGWYKRRSQTIILGLGLAVTVLANADSLAIGNALGREKALREALVSASEEYVEVQKEQPPAPGKPTVSVETPESWLETRIEGLRPLGLPLGWGQVGLRWDPLSCFQRALGWAITALAISLGAPFWFDLLNRFMIVRSTVKPHEKSPEEKSMG